MNGLSVTSMTKHTASWCCSPAATAQGACPEAACDVAAPEVPHADQGSPINPGEFSTKE